MITAPSIRITGRADIGGVTLFDALDQTLPGGQWSCLLGASGVGKSTILRLIAELQTGAKFTGEIVASDGEPLSNRVAYMAQDDLLLPWATVRQNVGLGAKLRGEQADHAKIDALLSETGLGDHAQKRPSELSGGQRQRVALARTLMEDKPIILLDEPFSALDARTRADMQELAHRLLAGRTVLLVTHEPAEAARLGDVILIMTESGLEQVTPPKAETPRRIDDSETLRVQAQLLNQLRAPIS